MGGHMNETDESLFAMDEQAYRAVWNAKVNEEIKIDAPFEDRIVALLNDDTDRRSVACILASFTYSTGRAEGGKTRSNDHGLTFCEG